MKLPKPPRSAQPGFSFTLTQGGLRIATVPSASVPKRAKPAKPRKAKP